MLWIAVTTLTAAGTDVLSALVVDVVDTVSRLVSLTVGGPEDTPWG